MGVTCRQPVHRNGRRGDPLNTALLTESQKSTKWKHRIGANRAPFFLGWGQLQRVKGGGGV